MQTETNFMCLVLGTSNRLGIVLLYCQPSLPAGSLAKVMETVLDLVLRKTPRLITFGNFNIHAETSLLGQAQESDFMAAMTACVSFGSKMQLHRNFPPAPRPIFFLQCHPKQSCTLLIPLKSGSLEGCNST